MNTWLIFQSTLPHGERRLALRAHDLLVDISIHAPAWGATVNAIVQKRLAKISIHAPAWGATRPQVRPTVLRDFNPRSRMGSDDHAVALRGGDVLFQSTLPHGERRDLVPSIVALRENFNPRSRMGSDGVIGLKLTLHERFQSTLPHGERPPLYLRPLQAQAISIHAPAWGATTALQRSFINILFQSTLPHGERLTGVCGHDVGPWISIHAPAWGAT